MTTTGFHLEAARRSGAANDAALVLATWLEAQDGEVFEPVFIDGPVTIVVGKREIWDKAESGRLIRWLADNVIDPHPARLAPSASYSYAAGAILLLEDLGMVKVDRRSRDESERHNFVTAVRLRA